LGGFFGIDARERAIDQIGPQLLLEVVVAPVEQMLQDQHPNDDLGGVPSRPRRRLCGHRRSIAWATTSITDSSEQRVDPSQPVRPQLVAIGQQHFEETPLALSASNHARSSETLMRAV
jgi:hypothetical protein